jgi:hypothetical protein
VGVGARDPAALTFFVFLEEHLGGELAVPAVVIAALDRTLEAMGRELGLGAVWSDEES